MPLEYSIPFDAVKCSFLLFVSLKMLDTVICAGFLFPLVLGLANVVFGFWTVAVVTCVLWLLNIFRINGSISCESVFRHICDSRLSMIGSHHRQAPKAKSSSSTCRWSACHSLIDLVHHLLRSVTILATDLPCLIAWLFLSFVRHPCQYFAFLLALVCVDQDMVKLEIECFPIAMNDSWNMCSGEKKPWHEWNLLGFRFSHHFSNYFAIKECEIFMWIGGAHFTMEHVKEFFGNIFQNIQIVTKHDLIRSIRFKRFSVVKSQRTVDIGKP